MEEIQELSQETVLEASPKDEGWFEAVVDGAVSSGDSGEFNWWKDYGADWLSTTPANYAPASPTRWAAGLQESTLDSAFQRGKAASRSDRGDSRSLRLFRPSR